MEITDEMVERAYYVWAHTPTTLSESPHPAMRAALEAALVAPKEPEFFDVRLHRSDVEAIQRALVVMRTPPVWAQGSSILKGWLGIESTFEKIIHAARSLFDPADLPHHHERTAQDPDHPMPDEYLPCAVCGIEANFHA